MNMQARTLHLQHNGDLGRNDFFHEEHMSEQEAMLLLQRAEQRFTDIRLSEKRKKSIKPGAKIPKLDVKPIAPPYVSTASGIARSKPQYILKDEERQVVDCSQNIQCISGMIKNTNRSNPTNSASDLLIMPRTQLKPEILNDMRLLNARGVLDPQRHYKKEFRKSLVPGFSEVGTIIEGPTEHFSARLPLKRRKRTLVEEVLADHGSVGRFKMKYDEIQDLKTSGKRAHYEKLRKRRLGGK